MSKTQYSKLTILELKELCRTKNIKNYSGLNKDDLVKLVKKNIKSGGMRRDRGLYISNNNLFSMAYYHLHGKKKTYDMINVSINFPETNFKTLIKSKNLSTNNLKRIFNSIIRSKNTHSTPSDTFQRDITLAKGDIIVYNGENYEIKDILYHNIVKLMGEKVPYAISCGEEVTFYIDDTDFWINIFLNYFREHNNEQLRTNTRNPEHSINSVPNNKKGWERLMWETKG